MIQQHFINIWLGLFRVINLSLKVRHELVYKTENVISPSSIFIINIHFMNLLTPNYDKFKI